MFAQNHHPAMRFIMPVRKSISEKTVFNVLGPLTNPAGVDKFLLGVFDKSFVGKIAEALKLNGSQNSMVVSAAEGMDEISISGVSYVARLHEGNILEYEIDPEMFGLKKAPFEAILGGDAKINAEIFTNVLSGKATDPQRDIVLLNTAHALVVDGKARDVQDGLDIARDSIANGKAIAKLKKIVEVSSKL